MKIDRVEAVTLRFEYERGFKYAGGVCTGRLTTLVRVSTDDGRVGIGSGYSHPGLLHPIIEHQLSPLLIGENPADIKRLWQKMYAVTRWYGRKGAAMTAVGALDTALWDLRGQAEGQPVWKLLGGDTPHCPAYASALLWKSPEELADEARALIARGFRRVKMRLALGADADGAAVEAVRTAIGPDCDLLVDGSMRYDEQSARQLAELLRDNDVFWYEEPFPPENIDGYVRLRRDCEVPLAAGENEFGAQGFRELIRAGAVDIVQPDASRCGGISETWNVCKMAREAGLRVATHSWCDAVAVIANAHVIAAAENGLTVEIDQTGNPFIEDLLTEPLVVLDGMLTLSDAPGLGIALNEDVVDRYRLDDPYNIPDGNYSDMVFGRQFLADL